MKIINPKHAQAWKELYKTINELTIHNVTVQIKMNFLELSQMAQVRPELSVFENKYFPKGMFTVLSLTHR